VISVHTVTYTRLYLARALHMSLEEDQHLPVPPGDYIVHEGVNTITADATWMDSGRFVTVVGQLTASMSSLWYGVI
jgi:hypothetical protein